MKPLSFLFLCLAAFSRAQDAKETKDLRDLIPSKYKGDNPDTSTKIVKGRNYIALLPVIGYAPANGVVLGAAIGFSRLFHDDPTNVSSGMLNAQITSKQQFIINARSKIFLLQNKWSLQGDWRILFFAQPTYGLGIVRPTIPPTDYAFSINGQNDVSDKGALPPQDMRFNYLRVYEDVVRSISRTWFAGLGFALDYHSKIRDQTLQPDTTKSDVHFTDHYLYSVAHDFNPEKYTTAGIKFNILADTRDNVANAYRGYLISFSFRVNPTFLGSTKNSTMLLYDTRYFLPLSKERPRHLIAFWSWGTFVTSGDVPYLALPSIGWDAYNRSGRGYIQGRYRGLSMAYAESEYRFPLRVDGLLGGVTFVNVTMASSPSQKLFDAAAPGAGVGIRIKMDKRTRTNINVDYAVGLDRSTAIYFNLQECF